MAKKLLTSPRGLAVYPWLNKPDTKFKAEGQYKVGLKCAVTDPGAIKLMETIDAGMAQAVASVREQYKDDKARLKKIKPCDDKPYKIETDDDDNETGFVVFNFKQTASGVSKRTGKEFTMKPALFDGTGTPLGGEVKVGGGSTIRVSYEIAEFFQVKIGAGVSLRMSGVQVIKLVEWAGGDASSHGFGVEEDAGGFGEDAVADEDEDEEKEEKPVPAAKAKAKKTKTPAPAPAAAEEDDDSEDDDF